MRLAALLGVEPVDEQDAVEVVGLVLHAARQQVGALDGDRLAVRVEAAGDDLHGARGVEAQARAATGSPPAPSCSSSPRVEVGVDQVAEDAVDVSR